MAKSGVPIEIWSGSGATDRLHESVVQYSEAASAQTRVMIRLTWAIVVLTFLLFVGLVVQIVLATD